MGKRLRGAGELARTSALRVGQKETPALVAGPQHKETPAIRGHRVGPSQPGGRALLHAPKLGGLFSKDVACKQQWEPPHPSFVVPENPDRLPHARDSRGRGGGTLRQRTQCADVGKPGEVPQTNQVRVWTLRKRRASRLRSCTAGRTRRGLRHE
ncbi:hypothetical protein NDU88_007291 [Pleurodeles waltl]|uniref:Uncharacterized protein n=1 Tax=Pleurodeles waltl TaxID=8319 RepID=A0AAV7QKG4_PLEWA|nr:hypothetical protein NDU88_007291 [Pleurodeles waltl]